jgi:deoxyribonuclease V
MLACVDVSYRVESAVAACVVFEGWKAREPATRYVVDIPAARPYEPGRFYLRELPCLLAVVGKVCEPLDVIIVDGYVWLDGAEGPGLGAHLYEALGRKTAVIGVAKSCYRGCDARPVYRGASRRPLYVSAAGLELAEAAQHIQEMDGAYRVPTLLRDADHLCRRRA